MNKIPPVMALCLLLSIFTPGRAQSWDGTGSSYGIKTSLGFEYFQRTVSLGENTDNTTEMKNMIFHLGADYYFQENISMGVFIGYALSSFEQVIFRELPFSLQLNKENLTGILTGARFSAGSLHLSQFELKGSGQFVYFIGSEQNWDISGLAEAGDAAGKSDWMRVAAGPVIWYTEPLLFSPYLAVQFNYLWGTYSMEESIGNLSGSEEKKFQSKSYVSLAAGGAYRLTPGLEITAGADLIPSEKGVDFGIMLNIAYIF
ncbi:MAG: hypothetical protein R6V02_11375 [Candidatus Aminicenantes bacterium]